MKQLLVLSSFLCLTNFLLAQETNADARVNYIKQYKDLAISEMERSGVPASITLGQAIVESNAGQSTLAREANNHFGIKCGNNWDGKSYYIEDDDRDASGTIVKSCFRKYKKAETSYEDHSDFLRDPKKYNRYGFLFHLNKEDYRSWANGLQSAGYATAPTYANSLINVIEFYRLHEFDKMNSGSGENSPKVNVKKGIGRINDVKVVMAKSGESLDDIAKIYRIKVDKLIGFNDNGIARSDKLEANTRIFLQKKKKKWHGRAKTHYVKDEQTMYEISQMYGVRLDKLLARNKMKGGEEPANSEEIRLKGCKFRADKPRLRANSDQDGRPTKTSPVNVPATNTDMTTEESDLFEIDNGEIKDKDKNNSGTKPDLPATTGTPVPNTPPSTTTEPKTTPVIIPPVTRPTDPATTGPGTYHTVIKGDTLYNISKRYATTVDKLKKLNSMTEDSIKIGQQLRVK